ncbi:MAG TPA: HepT-like ribonuclease domain-containing protein [Leadbetterella sp.]|nr:HepT-like ribonuclease domain-containing protein [Leadbetterella sp.]
MSLEEKKLLSDIKECIISIDEHLESRRFFSEYVSNKTKRRAVERELEIIGEATNQLLKINPNIEIAGARFIVNLRNKVIHSYDTVDNEIIWKIVMKDLPKLLEDVEMLLIA